jgi:hypothetical protein
MFYYSTSMLWDAYACVVNVSLERMLLLRLKGSENPTKLETRHVVFVAG